MSLRDYRNGPVMEPISAVATVGDSCAGGAMQQITPARRLDLIRL
jgi:hypothetical protein